MNETKVFIEAPTLHFASREPHSVRKVELPLTPLYGRFNPIPRKERVSKVTGLNFSKENDKLNAKRTFILIHAKGFPIVCAKTKDGKKIKLKNYTNHLIVKEFKNNI